MTLECYARRRYVIVNLRYSIYNACKPSLCGSLCVSQNEFKRKKKHTNYICDIDILKNIFSTGGSLFNVYKSYKLTIRTKL